MKIFLSHSFKLWHRKKTRSATLAVLLLTAAFNITATSFAQTAKSNSSISGKITSEDGTPLENASITLKGLSKAAISDKNGEFHITAVNKDDILVVNTVGYEKKEIPIGGRNYVLVTLKTQTGQLDEVVVIGYGTAKRQYLTGSVVKVSAADIEKQPVANPLQALQGRTAGVVITSSSGIPGADISVQIRGVNSVSAGTKPLYIIDGVPVESSSISKVYTAGGYISPLNAINPADIESIEILKDADATAIYGSRGANGVVLITTKKGKAGRTKLDADFSSGQSQVARRIDFLNTPEYVKLRRAAFVADGIAPDADNAPDLLVWDSTKTTDWQNLLIGNTNPFTNAQVNLSGGDERTRLLVGAGYHDEGTVLIGGGYDKRANLHVNVDHSSLDKRFLLTTSLTYGNDNIKTIASDPFWYLATAPNQPVYDSTGKKPYWLGAVSEQYNPVAYKYSNATTKTDNFIGSLNLKYKIATFLEAKVDFGYTRQNQRQISTFPSTSLDPNYNYGYSNYADFGTSYSQSYSIEPQLNFSKNIAQKGRLGLLVGGTFQRRQTGGDLIEGINFSSDALLESLGAAATIDYKKSTSTDYKYASVFSRLNYAWDDKYIFNGVYRRDGSSRFGPDKRFGDFWSVGGAWIFSKEKFIANALPFINYGKLRGSYGLTGNDQIGDYQYLQTYTSTTYPYQGSPGLYPNRLSNPNFSWEKNKKLEFALDAGLFKNRVSFTVAWYRNRSSNQLVSYPLASQTGFTSYQANLNALVQNQGWEFEFTTKNIVQKDFQWSSTFNITFAKNKLLSFPGLASSSYANTYVIGQSLHLLKMYHFTGINQQNGVPEVQDVDKDGVYSYPNDYVNAGTTDPKFYGGLSNSFTYKGFTLDVFLQFTKQIGYGYLWVFYQPPGFMYNVSKQYATNYWQKAGDKAAHSGLTATAGTAIYDAYYYYYTFSDATLSDASYIRLKNVSLSWQFPAKWLKKLPFENARVFLQGQNLLTFTRYDALDPETQTSTPVLKTFTAGVHITL